MKRLIASVPVVAMLTALVVLGVADSATSIANTDVPDDRVATSVDISANTNSRANATITITMYAVADK